MARAKTHDPLNRDEHHAESVEDTRTPQAIAEGYAPAYECDDCDFGPGAAKRDEEAERALEDLALASLEVALDSTPGSDDDHAKDFGLHIDDVDTQVPGKIEVTLRDGRMFRITAKAEIIGIAREPFDTTDLRAVRWNFDIDSDEPVYDGWTDGSDWNGFPTIWVTPGTHQRVTEYLAKTSAPDGTTLEDLEELRAMKPDKRGLICYGGGYTPVVK